VPDPLSGALDSGHDGLQLFCLARRGHKGSVSPRRMRIAPVWCRSRISPTPLWMPDHEYGSFVSRNVDRLIAEPLAGRVLGPGGEHAFVLAEWSDDGARGAEPIAPPHVHLEEDEAWYVLEGRLGFRLGDREIEVDAGGAVFGARGITHNYWNAGPGVARYLLVMGPRTWAVLEALHDGSPRNGRAVSDLYLAHGIRLISPPAS